MSDDCVILSLIDFKALYNDEDNSTIKEFGWLRKMFRNPKIPFSYNFIKSGFFDLEKVENVDAEFVDIIISYQYNCFIIFTNDKIYFVDRSSNLLIHQIVFKTCVPLLDENNDELYTTGPTGVVKFKLSKLMRTNRWQDCVVWDKKIITMDMYGIDIYTTSSQRFLVINEATTDYLTFINCETGDLVEDFKPLIKLDGCSLLILENQELIIPFRNEIGIYQIAHESTGMPKVNISKSKPLPPSDFYGMVYDSSRQYIILTNTFTDSVLVLRRSNLEIVKEHKMDGKITGICLDERSGELLIASSGRIIKFK